MKRLVSRIIVVALALGSLAAFGVTTASAATHTIVLSGGDRVAVLTGSSIITATASVPGSVSFTAIDLVIPGCDAVLTTTGVAPFIARCNWTPTAEGSASLGATLRPTDATNTTVIAKPLIVKIGVPTQGIFNTITVYADTVLGSGATGVLKPQLGGACALTGNFMLGQMIVFRAYANDATRGGEALTSLNTLSAAVTVAGVAKPIPLTYGTSAGRDGRGFWTAAMPTGTAAGLYNTLGIVTFKVTFIAKDSNSVKVLSTKLVAVKKDGKRVVDANGRTVYERVAYYKTVSQFPAVKGATGTFESNMFPASSQVTVHPVPTS